MRTIKFIPIGSDFVPDMKGRFVVTTDCCRCGTQTRVEIDKDVEFDRTEADYWENQYKELMGSVNSLIRYIEIETGWNPAKEKTARMLVEIRNRIAGGS